MQEPLHFPLTIVFPGQIAALDEPGALALVLTLAIAQLIQPFEQVFVALGVGRADIFIGGAELYSSAELRTIFLALKSGWFSTWTISLAPHSKSAPLMKAIHLAGLSS